MPENARFYKEVEASVACAHARQFTFLHHLQQAGHFWRVGSAGQASAVTQKVVVSLLYTDVVAITNRQRTRETLTMHIDANNSPMLLSQPCVADGQVACGCGGMVVPDRIGSNQTLHQTNSIRHRIQRARNRGFTLLELIVVVVLSGMMMSAVVVSLGAVTNAKLKAAATMVAAAIRGAYTRSSSTSNPTRVVLDLEDNRIWLEEGSRQMLVQAKDYGLNGGAEPATQAEKDAIRESESIVKGPKAPRTNFKTIKQIGFEADDKGGGVGRSLGKNISFREVFVAHQAEAVREGRTYLYVWPGGQTEMAYIQLMKHKGEGERDVMTLFVHPLTGKVSIKTGTHTIRFPENPEDNSERDEEKLF
jgi:general secretion pathway protein H